MDGRSGDMSKSDLKKIPVFGTDSQAEDFVENADPSEYDLSGFHPMHFEFEKKSAQLKMRLPETLLQAVKAKAKERGIPYTRLIRETLEQTVRK
jgi:predicted DNA binding CopG/RHH family protein